MKNYKKLDDLAKVEIKSGKIQPELEFLVFCSGNALRFWDTPYCAGLPQATLAFCLSLPVSVFLKGSFFFSNLKCGQDLGLSPLVPSPPHPLAGPIYPEALNAICKLIAPKLMLPTQTSSLGAGSYIHMPAW